MRLCEHEDFATLLVAAAQSRGLNEQFVEKDYYVTKSCASSLRPMAIGWSSRAARASPRAGS
jgi:hypothetical protein